MKRIFTIFSVLFILSMPVFAQSNDEQNEPDQDTVYTYDQNGKGDQFIKIGIMPNFPLNFDKQLYVGGAVQLGYYRFMTNWLAVGGELMAGYDLTKGSNIFTFVPITAGVMFQPTIWKFEFPVTLSLGMAFETCQNKKYFPGFVAKADAGVFFRIAESWSFGLSGQFLFLPQWYTTTPNAGADYGMFMQATVSARYHF